ncbi:MAG: HEPN domain-containing protein [Kiritimatiellae bacterium]|nr:HEPN domain-containing protein [Verrucomicrobiota bacterium]MBU4286438.1 HEPN domain-containing protein [Verrucomicrobiota bacterium]MBU4366406.1 HEPN domain-containing protein [Verrucomicrobiota bacterium]MCG2659412.1 HEPN domain-containing protein [Kiritimatiellia bacterium]
MRNHDDILNIVSQWIQKAESDFINARHTLGMGADCPYDTVCFHSQQGAEKYIKALLSFLSIDFPKVHDIGRLIHLLPDRVKFSINVAEQELLTSYAIVTRYPGDEEPLTRADAKQALVIARSVRRAVRKHLQIRHLNAKLKNHKH